ncbi:unnamed protein product [Ilex paraguariensis]|uniref:Disease resistance protein At4g27190-like leucine-rich repeats domain-containing protein n=1 Tax=Ilex paraguariensis TaxID=185542 RepID=A0ABC8S642_9AQUA
MNEIMFPQLEELIIDNCGKLRNLFSPSMARGLVHLRELRISKCPMLEEIVVKEEEAEEGSRMNEIMFPQLEELIIDNCGKLRNLFSPSMARGLVHLRELRISKCPMLEEIVVKEEEAEEGSRMNEIMFPQLEELIIDNCGKLRNLFSPSMARGLVHLRKLRISKCPMLEEVVVKEEEAEEGSRMNEIMFPQLEELIINNCGKLRNLFSPSMARGLVHLRKLIIADCPMLEEVVVKEEEAEGGSRMNEIMFPQLKTLILGALLKLRSFFPVKHALELPSLHEVTLYICPEMKNFSLGPLSTPKLENVYPLDNPAVCKDDLNNTIRHLHETEGPRWRAQLESTSKEAEATDHI